MTEQVILECLCVVSKLTFLEIIKLLAYTSTGTLRHSASCMDIYSSSHPCTCQQICPTATASQTVKAQGW